MTGAWISVFASYAAPLAPSLFWRDLALWTSCVVLPAWSRCFLFCLVLFGSLHVGPVLASLRRDAFDPGSFETRCDELRLPSLRRSGIGGETGKKPGKEPGKMNQSACSHRFKSTPGRIRGRAEPPPGCFLFCDLCSSRVIKFPPSTCLAPSSVGTRHSGPVRSDLGNPHGPEDTGAIREPSG